MILTDITNIGDPFVLNADGKYYLYATGARDGFKVFVSTNLKDWSDGTYCYRESTWADQDFWAPEVVRRGEKYLMFFSARDKTKRSLRLSAAISDFPEGPFTDISDKPVFDFGYAAIDATVFTDDDGRSYMYFARDCSQNVIGGIHVSELYGVELTRDLLHTVGEPVRVSTPDTEWETRSGDWRWNEAPAMLKHGGKYYLNYSTNCFNSKLYSVCYAVSTRPLDGFVKAAENPVLKFIEGKISGPGHNSYFLDADGKLKTVFHIHTRYSDPSGDRRACIGDAGIVDGKLVLEQF